jgi:cyanate lyase
VVAGEGFSFTLQRTAPLMYGTTIKELVHEKLGKGMKAAA